jgi:DNA primase
VATRIPEHTIAEVREKTDVVHTIGRYVQLRKSGANFKGLCPFHTEKTPSFVVNPARQSFYCFGCHEKGNVIGFLMQIEGKTFMEVLKELAEEAGVDLPKREMSEAEQQRESEREGLLRINKIAQDFFVEQLAAGGGAQARKYLASRDLEDRVVAAYGIGFAPAGWDGLTKNLAAARVPAPLAVKLGLCMVRRNQAGERLAAQGTVSPTQNFDFFRDRLMFPVLGAGGSVLGFSGRLLDPEAKERKYVNSPESPVYRKSETLYGLPVARPAMRRHDRVILVEGNVDVVGLYQAGHEEVVAPLGTALTDRQVLILRRFVREVVLAYDGDSAGRTASRKAAEMLAAEDVTCRVAILPDGSDPADLVRHQPELLGQLLTDAAAGPAYLIDEATKGLGSSVEDRVAAAETLAPILNRIRNPVVRDEYFQRAAAAVGLRPDQVLRAVRGVGSSSQASPAKYGDQDLGNGPTAGPAAPPTEEQRYVLELLTLMVAHPRLVPQVADKGVVSYLEDEEQRELLREAVRMQAATGRVDADELLELLEPAGRDQLARHLDSHAYDGEGVDASRALADTIGAIRLRWLERELKRLDEAVKEAKTAGDSPRRRELIERLLAVRLEKDELKNAVAKGTNYGTHVSMV